jgi:MinD superfamily P-loop ATPase
MKIAIASGKGGTGKTFISTNLFWTVQNASMPVVLVDCDAEEPNVAEFINGKVTQVQTVTQKVPVIDAEKCTFCGKCHGFCNYHAIIYLPPAGFIQVVEELCHDCGACSFACEFGAITEKEKQLGEVTSMGYHNHSDLIEARADVGVYSPVPVIKQAIKQANEQSLILFDSPPGISCPFIATVDKADYVILVTEPTPFGLNDLKLSVETLKQLNKPFGVVINRAGLGDRSVYEWLDANHIELLMEIPFDREIARIYSEGFLLVEMKPDYQALFLSLLNRIIC